MSDDNRANRASPKVVRFEEKPPRPLISVHFPKSGGSAFRASLLAAFGTEKLALAYGFDPVDPANPMWIAPSWFFNRRPQTIAPHTAVHGHIPVSRYDLVPGAARIVMLREPVENLISIYYFWLQSFQTDTVGHAIFEFVKANRLTLLEVAELSALRRLMSSSYFGGYDMRRFDVIGVFERQEAFRTAVSSILGLEIPAAGRVNVTPPSEERGNVLCDTKLMAKLRHLLADDIRFFGALSGRFA
jgi:hypothetical protein